MDKHSKFKLPIQMGSFFGPHYGLFPVGLNPFFGKLGISPPETCDFNRRNRRG